jgi:hypothetical protein
MRTPYLIQRAEINTPLAEKTSRLSNAVGFDYMGSAEFEFGALPKSFRRIESQADAFVCRLVPEITEDETPLRVWSYLSDKDFETYKGYLLRFRNPGKDPMHTKEGVRFEAGREKSKYGNTDFWWDIDNDVMFGFKKEFMKRVGDYVTASLAFMNEQKAKQ